MVDEFLGCASKGPPGPPLPKVEVKIDPDVLTEYLVRRTSFSQAAAGPKYARQVNNKALHLTAGPWMFAGRSERPRR